MYPKQACPFPKLVQYVWLSPAGVLLNLHFHLSTSSIPHSQLSVAPSSHWGNWPAIPSLAERALSAWSMVTRILLPATVPFSLFVASQSKEHGSVTHWPVLCYSYDTGKVHQWNHSHLCSGWVNTGTHLMEPLHQLCQQEATMVQITDKACTHLGWYESRIETGSQSPSSLNFLLKTDFFFPFGIFWLWLPSSKPSQSSPITLIQNLFALIRIQPMSKDTILTNTEMVLETSQANCSRL